LLLTINLKSAIFWVITQLILVIGTSVAQWLRYCATNQKVAGSIPDGVMEIFIDINPSDRTTALGSTQPLTYISTGVFRGSKCGRCVRLTTLPPSCAVVVKSGNLNFLEPSGSPQACNGTDLTFILVISCGRFGITYRSRVQGSTNLNKRTCHLLPT
jgi:hypothetical protein